MQTELIVLLCAQILPIFVICVVFLTLNLHCQKCFIIPLSLTLYDLRFLSTWTNTKRLLALGLVGHKLPSSLLQLFQQKRQTDKRMRGVQGLKVTYGCQSSQYSGLQEHHTIYVQKEVVIQVQKVSSDKETPTMWVRMTHVVRNEC